MELSDYRITSVHIKGSNNILADAISRSRDPLENPKTTVANDTDECITYVLTNKLQTLSKDKLHAEQRKDITCRNLAVQSYHKNRNSFNLVMNSADGLLQKQQYKHGLIHDVIIALCSVIPIIHHEFHNSQGHHRTIHTFEAIR